MNGQSPALQPNAEEPYRERLDAARSLYVQERSAETKAAYLKALKEFADYIQQGGAA